MPNPNRTPADVAERKQESRHGLLWYPFRCELEGCESKDSLLKCAGCKMVHYCCKEHQLEDWKTHKTDCKVFQRNKIRAAFYTDEEMLQRYPLTPPPGPRKKDREGSILRLYKTPPRQQPIAEDAKCLICNKVNGEVDLKRTFCCQQVVCDNQHEYQSFSYSREFCERSHEKYTLCGRHGDFESCAITDWRDCANCVRPYKPSQLTDTLWRGLNPYNYCPMLEKDVPRHALCDTCADCGNKFLGDMEGYTMRPVGGRNPFCCEDILKVCKNCDQC